MNYLKILSVLGAITLTQIATAAEKKPVTNIIEGPGKARMESVAEIQVPPGYLFLDGKTTRALMKRSGEPTSGREYGAFMPTNENWTVIFEYDDIGYVKDDDKDQLNADKLLEAIKRGTAAANKEREKAGHAPLEIIGWEQPPRYDATTHNLEWAIRAQSEGRQILNYNTRLLGRKGVMEVVLIVEPEKLAATLPEFRQVLTGYAFQTGQNYAEFRAGDKVAKYGLGALVVGGAAVGAAKLGLFAWLAVFFKKGWKLLVIVVAAVAAFFKKIFSGRGRGQAMNE